MTFHSGFVTLIGRPNVGKSTLMNRLVGEKIAIISNKPQTTRHKILSVAHGEDYQIVFMDTPGIHQPKSKLGEFMVKSTENAMREVDIVIFLTSPWGNMSKNVHKIDMNIIQHLQNVQNYVFLVVNKIDTIEKNKLLDIIDTYRQLYNFTEIIPLSASTGDNVDVLLENIRRYLPIGPQYFSKDMVTDQPERLIVAELIREKALRCLCDEVPHGVAVEILSMKKREHKNLVDVEAMIYCEKSSHKGIVIGKHGMMLKKIGSLARTEIANLLGSDIYLQLWVKVKKDWRDNDFLLRNFGYDSNHL